MFFSTAGLVAVVAEGVYAPTDDLHTQIRAFGEDNTLLTRRGAVPSVSIDRARQILLDDWTIQERIVKGIRDAYAWGQDRYVALGWKKAPFWLALAWLIAVISAAMIWLLVPHKLAHWAMPVVGNPPPPRWKWLAGILTLYGYLGTTRRPLKAWLRVHHDALYHANFSERVPVKERERYCNLDHENTITDFANTLAARIPAHVWITGVGGGGKSALAYRMLRVKTEDRNKAPLPVLVDEDWDSTLATHVAALMKTGERVPTVMMVETLGAMGLVCPIIDSLSERDMTNAVDSVGKAVRKGVFKTLVVTSRSNLPKGKAWETFKTLTAYPLKADQVPKYVATYAPEAEGDRVVEQIQPLVQTKQNLSPLFVRFAIEQVLAGETASTSALDLVLQYVEVLRSGRVDMSADDMVRAAAIAALETVRDSLTPREIEQGYLRGVLAKEADDLAFMNAANESVVDPASIIEMLVQCGLLNRNQTNRRLQFAYDPVAEHLAAYRVAKLPGKESVKALKARILEDPLSTLARAIQEIEKSDPVVETSG